MTYKAKKKKKITKKKWLHNMNKHVLSSLYRPTPFDTVYLFTSNEIESFIQNRTLEIYVDMDLVKINFIKNFPKNKVFLLTDGTYVRAWAKFTKPYVNTRTGTIQRSVYIRKMKEGFDKRFEFINGFSTKFQGIQIDLFTEFLEVPKALILENKELKEGKMLNKNYWHGFEVKKNHSEI